MDGQPWAGSGGASQATGNSPGFSGWPEEDNARVKDNLRGIDELFASVKEYAESPRFRQLLDFTARFKMYAVYNAMLIYLQRPGARYVLSPKEWEKKYDRQIKNGALPILVLQTMGPLRCVYDVADTLPIHPGPDEKFPPELSNPYDGDPTAAVELGTLQTLESRLRHLGIFYGTMQTGSDYSGKLEIGKANDPPLKLCDMPWKPSYTLWVHAGASDTVKFCTIVHELGHLFLRHMPSGYEKDWWLGPRCLSPEAEEFEAETVSWLVARRLGVDNPSYRYLAKYLDHHGEIPQDISVDEIIRAVNWVERIMAAQNEAIEFYERYNPYFQKVNREYRAAHKNRPKKR